jgi:uncharacterized membrane protein
MERTDLGRIMAFTDGVMAVAITLLVLNLEVPDLKDPSRLGEDLVDLLPSLLSYSLAFALVGRFWVVHHNSFETLRAFDGTLMTLNLLFLALIALMPFATDLFDRYNDEPIAAAVFGAILGLAALVNWLMHRHSLRAGLVKREHISATSPFSTTVALGFAVIFLLSVPAAFVSPYLAVALWVSTMALRYPLRRLAGTSSE